MTGRPSPSSRPVVERLEGRRLMAAVPSAGFTSIFNGTSLAGFSTYVDGLGPDNDSQKAFRAQGGVLRVAGGPRGYVATAGVYSNYWLRFDYKVAGAAARGGGVLLHVGVADELAPPAVEVQVQQNDAGDVLPLGGAGFDATVASTSDLPNRYKPAGTPVRVTDGGRLGRRESAAGLPADWNTVDVVAQGADGVVLLNGVVVNRWSGGQGPGGASLAGGRIAFQAEGAEVWYRNVGIKPTAWPGGEVDSTPPPEEPNPPEEPTLPTGAIRLIDGSNSTAAWERRDGGGAIDWPAVGSVLTVKPGGGDIVTRTSYRDFTLHVEFNVPATPAGTPEQDRGNSGIGLGGSYELQVLDSYNHPLSGTNDLGAIYGIRDASTNAARPAGQWQTYDVTFEAARWSGQTKVAPARATVRLNGVLIHDDVAISSSTFTFLPETPAGGPIVLQDHGNKVRYRNVWIVPG